VSLNLNNNYQEFLVKVMAMINNKTHKDQGSQIILRIMPVVELVRIPLLITQYYKVKIQFKVYLKARTPMAKINIINISKVKSQPLLVTLITKDKLGLSKLVVVKPDLELQLSTAHLTWVATVC